MFRILRFLVVLGVLVAGAVWLADRPGTVVLEWRGYRVDTSVALLVGAVALIAAFVALIYRMWLFLRRVPARIGRARHEGRRRRGFLALTRGMVAVAAGDSEEADRQVKRAEGLLSDPPLTMLLSAQAAQLRGDQRAAEKFFSAMLDRPETEFLGVRGLLAQAMKRADYGEALRLAHRAHRLRPDSEWVTDSLFDLQTRAGLWVEAQATLRDMTKNRRVAPDESRHRRAVLNHRLSLDAGDGGDSGQALERARKAHSEDPGFVPAALRLAGLLVDSGKGRKAAAVIEATWARQPHPDLLDIYWRAREANDALERVRATQRLVKANADHMESRIALARAALAARLWGEARKYLRQPDDDGAPARVCRLMAELEEAEHGDADAARHWLVRASLADPDPAWVCGSCGNWVADWSVLCGHCQSFDRFTWRTPPHVVAIGQAETAASVPAALPAAEGRIG